MKGLNLCYGWSPESINLAGQSVEAGGCYHQASICHEASLP